MRSSQVIRLALAFAAVCLALTLATCGGGSKRAMNPPSIGSDSQHRVPPAFQPVIDPSLESALAKLDALESPDGVDSTLFAQLKDALEEALNCRAATITGGTGVPPVIHAARRRDACATKLISAPPTGDENRVTDLAITESGDGTYTLTWHYRNLGDYDQDGTVGISDITPIAMHYGETYGIEDANCLLAVIDGSGNGVVDIADITPLAMNLDLDCEGYSIRGASSYPNSIDETLEIGTVGLADAAGEGRKYFNEPLPESEYQFFAVAPYDSEGNLGDLSNVIDLQEPVWHTIVVDSAEKVGQYISLAVVQGNPAISYLDATYHDLKYVRASDARGGSWGTPIILDSEGDVGYFTSLAVVNAHPAISYYDWTNGDLKYLRATDASGDSWGTPIILDSEGYVGFGTSLTVVNEKPAISYYDCTNDDLKYVRANDADGNTWGTPVTIDSAGMPGGHNSLALVNGNPAISYFDNTNWDLKYMRASDASGDSWGTPIILDSAEKLGQYTSLAMVNGNPAISYYDDTNWDLKYVRASDANGSSWETPQTVDSAGNVGMDTSLAVVQGNPAISYYDWTNGDLKYVRASDTSGGSWGTPIKVDGSGADVGYCTSLAVVNGNPAISYYDHTNGDLKFAIYY